MAHFVRYKTALSAQGIVPNLVHANLLEMSGSQNRLFDKGFDCIVMNPRLSGRVETWHSVEIEAVDAKKENSGKTFRNMPIEAAFVLRTIALLRPGESSSLYSHPL